MRFARLRRLPAELYALAILAAILVSPHSAFAQALAGSVTTVSGTVTLRRGAATLPVTGGMPVDVGDQINTGGDGHVTVLLTDQSTLELGDSSSFTLDQHSGTPSQTRINLLSGVLRSFVNRAAAAGAPNFEVHTPNAVAAARGTRFDTAYAGGAARPGFADCRAFTDVSVYDGAVFLANVNNPGSGVDVPSGYEATVPCTLSPTSPGPLGMTGATSMGAAGEAEVGGIGGAIAPVPPPVCPVPPACPCNTPPMMPPPPPGK